MIDLVTHADVHGHGPTPLHEDATIVAVVLRRGLDRHLVESVRSLEAQTRRPDRIVVVHDGSASPPVWLAEQFPEVSFLSAAEPSMAAALLQAVVERVTADGYLVQEETDWSAPDRLRSLLVAASRSQAELVGSDSMVVSPSIPDARMRRMPPDGNDAFRSGSGGPVVDPATMLVSRGLIERLGGFSTNQPVAAADEFVARAVTVARVVNVSKPLCMHRTSAHRDWSGPPSGASLVRRVVYAALGERARHHALALARREQPEVSLPDRPPAAELIHVAGPPLDPVLQRIEAPPSHRSNGAAARAESGVRKHPPVSPVLTMSGFDSLGRYLACCLGQHRNLTPVSVTDWLVEMGESAARYLVEQRRRLADSGGDVVTAQQLYRAASAAVDALFLLDTAEAADRAGGAAGTHRRWVGAVPGDMRALAAVAAMYPDARFIHVTRSVDDAVASQLGADDHSEAGDLYESWLRSTRAILEVRQLLDPDQVLLVAYEDLVDDPEGTMRTCLEFVGETDDRRCATLVSSAAEEGRQDRPIADFEGVPAQGEARLLSLALTRRAPSGHAERRISQVGKVLTHLADGMPHDRTPPDVDSGDDRNPYAAAHGLVRRHADRAAPVCVVSKGDEMAVRFRGRLLGWHFPQTEDGTYAGYHPADGREAIAHLEHLRDRGAQYLLIPDPFLWWLDHYTELRQHLARSYRQLPSSTGEGALFDLRDDRRRGEDDPR